MLVGMFATVDEGLDLAMRRKASGGASGVLVAG